MRDRKQEGGIGTSFRSVKQLLTPPGARTIDNGTLLNTMCDIAERREVGRFPPPTLDVFDDACSITSLACFSYLELIHEYLSR